MAKKRKRDIVIAVAIDEDGDVAVEHACPKQGRGKPSQEAIGWAVDDARDAVSSGSRVLIVTLRDVPYAPHAHEVEADEIAEWEA